MNIENMNAYTYKQLVDEAKKIQQIAESNNVKKSDLINLLLIHQIEELRLTLSMFDDCQE